MKIPFFQRHPTGFMKLVLLRVMGRTVRLHVWPNGNDGVRPDVHGHRFRFVSLPLKGVFVEEKFEVVDGEDFRVTNCADNGAILEDGGKASVRRVSRQIRKALRPYACGIDEVHTFEPATSRLSVSLVFMGKRRKERAPVYQP